MFTISARPLAAIPPPPLRSTMNVTTHWSMSMSPEMGRFLEGLAGRLPHGMHGLAWYLRWMILHYSPARELVMVERNRLLGEKALTAFSKHLRESVMNVYASQICSPGVVDRLDADTLFVYDHLQRIGRPAEANALLSRQGMRIAGEFIGLPFARCVLSPQTETALWTLVNCPACPF